MREFRARVKDRIWTFRFVDDLGKDYGVDGDCDKPTARAKSIRLDSSLKGWVLFETILHEAFHAAFSCIKEDDVLLFNRDVRRILEKLFDLSEKAQCESESSGTCISPSNTQDTSNSV